MAPTYMTKSDDTLNQTQTRPGSAETQVPGSLAADPVRGGTQGRRPRLMSEAIRRSVPQSTALVLSFLLVALTTCGLFFLQRMLARHDHLHSVRPFTIGYLIPIIVVTGAAGRRAGWGTLLLSVLATVYFLTAPLFSWHVQNDRYWTEVVMLIAVGCLVVSGVDAMRQNTMMLADISGTPEAEVVVAAIVRAASTFPEVRRVGACTVRRCGFDLYVEMDIALDDATPLGDAHAIVAGVEAAVYQSSPLMLQVRARPV